MTSPILDSGIEAFGFLASQVIQYTGGDTRLGRRVRLGAAVTLLAIAIRVVASGPPKRNGIQKDLRKVGKAVGDVGSGDDFDEYDIVIVGGGMQSLSTTTHKI